MYLSGMWAPTIPPCFAVSPRHNHTITPNRLLAISRPGSHPYLTARLPLTPGRGESPDRSSSSSPPTSAPSQLIGVTTRSQRCYEKQRQLGNAKRKSTASLDVRPWTKCPVPIDVWGFYSSKPFNGFVFSIIKHNKTLFCCLSSLPARLNLGRARPGTEF